MAGPVRGSLSERPRVWVMARHCTWDASRRFHFRSNGWIPGSRWTRCG
ncbi:rCG33258, isoform CRA_a [Rattus norvegicus]|uniref:RCG33258, isoform CRA_a n=1 Tax=Rattus norvegicus TaxID=10116 RepID=A6HKY5_RAT|nr:rCG33258, isoform CRA_a [Rattus norvegicus]